MGGASTPFSLRLAVQIASTQLAVLIEADSKSAKFYTSQDGAYPDGRRTDRPDGLSPSVRSDGH